MPGWQAYDSTPVPFSLHVNNRQFIAEHLSTATSRSQNAVQNALLKSSCNHILHVMAAIPCCLLLPITLHYQVHQRTSRHCRSCDCSYVALYTHSICQHLPLLRHASVTNTDSAQQQFDIHTYLSFISSPTMRSHSLLVPYAVMSVT